MAIRKDDPGISSVLKKPLLLRKWHREPEFMTILERYLEPEEIFFDLGCNIGYVALYVLQNLNKKGFLYAIDPDPKNISALKKSIEYNALKKSYTIENIALSSKDGEIGFEFSEESNLHKINNKLPEDSPTYRKINCRSFDSYFSNKSLPTFIKMDVEGAEIDILNGMKSFLESSSKCKILMELHPTLYSSKECIESFEILFKNGFKLEKFVGSAFAHSHPLLKENYIPSERFRSGGFTRAIYDNVTKDDFYKIILNKIPHKSLYNLSTYIRRPKTLLKPFLNSTKLARAALFVR
tara:strand:- start:1646 stop:2530 length:885 start_codon:yes stop_codon:yes gene_type:complete